MFRSKNTLVFAILMLLALATSAMAIDLPTLSQNMWKWSVLETVISEATGGPFTGTPAVPIDEAYSEIEKARMEVSKIVASITTAKELLEARTLAQEFIDMQDHEEDVGRALMKLLDVQEKYLQAHQ